MIDSKYMAMAKKAAMRGSPHRTHRVGAVAIRKDGAIVTSSNQTARDRMPSAHAEARLLNRSGYGAIIYVICLTRANTVVLAKPCSSCQLLMKNKKVAKIYYSDGDKIRSMKP